MTSTFIQTVEGNIVAVGEAAWTQIKSELSGLEDTVLADIKAAINTATSAASSGDTLEEIETAVLNILASSAPAIISALSSGALQVLIAMGKAAVAVL